MCSNFIMRLCRYQGFHVIKTLSQTCFVCMAKPQVNVLARKSTERSRDSNFGMCSDTFRERYVANPSALYRGQNPPNREQWVLEAKTPHFPSQRAFRVKKSPFSLWRPALYRNGAFLTRNALSWGFSNPKPSFPNFGVFDTCTGRTD